MWKWGKKREGKCSQIIVEMGSDKGGKGWLLGITERVVIGYYSKGGNGVRKVWKWGKKREENKFR